MRYLRKERCSDGGIVTYDSNTDTLTCSKCGSNHPRQVLRGETRLWLEKLFIKLEEDNNPSSRLYGT